MKIDNEPIAAKIKLLYMGIPAIIIITIGTLCLVSLHRGIVWLGIGLLLLVAFFMVVVLVQYNYIMLFVGPDKIVLRYKTLSPLRTSNNSIEMKAIDFAGYEITRSLGGLRRNITLFKNTPGGKAKFPRVCINLLSKEEIAKMKRSLDLVLSLKNERS